MGYISPFDPVYQYARSAEGPGVHTDEASAALPDLYGIINDSAWDTLADASAARDSQKTRALNARIDAETGPEVRANPAGKKRQSPPKVPQRELFPIAYLTTGMWGPDPKGLGDIRDIGRRKLPVAVDNPRLEMTFFDRMNRLLVELGELHGRASARYDAQKVPTSKRDWLTSIQDMAMAVQYVLTQQYSDRPTIMAHGNLPLGLPVGTWDPIAAQGNSKLKFVAYSDLPMVSCPGAGSCAVTLDFYEKKESSVKRHKLEAASRRSHDLEASRKADEWRAAIRAESNKSKIAEMRVELNRFLEEERAKKKRRTSKEEPAKGWCYSFKAFRYPGAFKRMFLNTLANYADREFAIIRAGGGHLPASDYDGRVKKALEGAKDPGGRVWMQHVKNLVLALTRENRASGKNVFFRLFVDGDINYEDNIVAWMDVCRQIGPGGEIEQVPGPNGPFTFGHVQVYGYSKCWRQFLAVDHYLGGKWPENYTVNLSSGSVYASAKFGDVRAAMEKLPITRWYFEAIPLDQYIDKLREQTELMAKNPQAVVPMTRFKFQNLAFDEERIRAFIQLNAIQTADELERFGVPVPKDSRGRAKQLSGEQVRRIAYEHYLNRLIADPSFGAFVRKELLKDEGMNPSEGEFLLEFGATQRDIASRILEDGTRQEYRFTQDMLSKKALAIALHETFWALDLGGSCPLVCGNCSDHPTDPTLGVHRCASKDSFAGKTIAIGLHVMLPLLFVIAGIFRAAIQA